MNLVDAKVAAWTLACNTGCPVGIYDSGRRLEIRVIQRVLPSTRRIYLVDSNWVAMINDNQEKEYVY